MSGAGAGVGIGVGASAAVAVVAGVVWVLMRKGKGKKRVNGNEPPLVARKGTPGAQYAGGSGAYQDVPRQEGGNGRGLFELQHERPTHELS